MQAVLSAYSDFSARRESDQLANVKISTGCSTPFTGCGGNARNEAGRCKASRVALLISKVVSRVLFKPSMREATFTVLPMTVNSIRSGEPMLPTMAGPVLMPMPMAMGASPRWPSSRLRRSSRRCKERPAASALSG